MTWIPLLTLQSGIKALRNESQFCGCGVHNPQKTSVELTWKVQSSVRSFLTDAGFQPHLSSGAVISMNPMRFCVAQMAVSHEVELLLHVTVIESLKLLVMEYEHGLPRKQTFCPRSLESNSDLGGKEEEPPHVELVRHTFLEEPGAVMRVPGSVTGPSERRATNPRRFSVRD
mmetsp:Transcript_11663/g.24154  ORF Transcript_11663/g.24154 Transcript_11663/m.24154 type:complete len:172 (+) Transcript_11663:1157-1672(+)